MCGDFTWSVSDCEELNGSYSHEMVGGVLGGLLFYLFPIHPLSFDVSVFVE